MFNLAWETSNWIWGLYLFVAKCLQRRLKSIWMAENENKQLPLSLSQTAVGAWWPFKALLTFRNCLTASLLAAHSAYSLPFKWNAQTGSFLVGIWLQVLLSVELNGNSWNMVLKGMKRKKKWRRSNTFLRIIRGRHWEVPASKETIMRHKGLLEVCSGCSDLKRATVIACSTIALGGCCFAL